MKSKKKSTFDRIMSDSEEKKKFDKEYMQFLFSELILEAMEEERISVRELSKKSGVSTSIIHHLRAMKPINITIKTLTSLLKPLGYQLVATKGGTTVKLSS
ncbi:MAG: hypothetical protein OMM_08151 [Candidatus Magnetoglobus multicellularis str. Araruama]|uniref:HTH cro/C1-type domain-containing protein n=2 Tax=Candidatus Magnetoglobus multicellularis str. Araruama TaxID=890399 RepID=A0A1V1P9E2_9BACT|nr:MAG: hypothetical protein OMM_08151 [Candidatus Magnetoglobus multicellularis str. Araruama]